MHFFDHPSPVSQPSFSFWLLFHKLTFSLQALYCCFSFTKLSKHASDTTVSWTSDSISLESLGIGVVQAQAGKHLVDHALRDLDSRRWVELEQKFSEFWISLTCEVKREKLRSNTGLLSFLFCLAGKKIYKIIINYYYNSHYLLVRERTFQCPFPNTKKGIISD